MLGVAFTPCVVTALVNLTEFFADFLDRPCPIPCLQHQYVEALSYWDLVNHGTTKKNFWWVTHAVDVLERKRNWIH